MSRTRVHLIAVTVLVVLVMLAVPAAAQYPTKALELVIPWTPGSASDLAVRMLARYAEKHLGQAIMPVNQVGGNGAVAWTYASKAKPDGYTITLVTFDVLTNQAMGSDVKFDTFDYLLQFSHQPMGIYVHKDSPYRTLQELVNAAKARPGGIKVGTTGLGGLLHQAAYLVEKKYGVKFNIVPFKGSAEILAAELGRHVDADVNTTTLAAQHIKAGTLRMLLSFGAERLRDYADVPSIKELGISESGFESWRAVGIPKGGPVAVKSKLASAFKKAYDDPEYQELAKKSNYDLHYRSNGDFQKFAAQQYPMVVTTLKGIGYAK
ncbi:MAG: tripartite tricarboxylate transporter substrate binding protein [Candidatus Rokubacteria bacterium]|nr:tripartite tricarboxylate transporter substrate binding protein [Candidatus Rokubacteria bacterium]